MRHQIHLLLICAGCANGVCRAVLAQVPLASDGCSEEGV